MFYKKTHLSTAKISLLFVLACTFLIAAPASAFAAKAQAAPLIPVYRLYNAAQGDHFYTINLEERNRALGSYASEGVAFSLTYDSNKNTAGLYRMFCPGSGDHFYTTSVSERNGALGAYVYEGIAWFVATQSSPGAMPVYRLFNPGTGDHFYTASEAEKNGAIGAYRYEGIAYYIPTVTAANEVSALIAAMPSVSSITLSNSTQIGEARLAYDALAVSQKPDVTNYAILTAAEAQLDALSDATDAVAAAENDLTQASVDTANALMPAVAAGGAKTALQARIDAIQSAVDDIDAVIALIDALPSPTNLTLSDSAQVMGARSAYDALTATQKGLVTNYATLTAAEAQINALSLADFAVTNAESALTQDSIDTAQNNIDDCVAGSAKTALQNRLNAVQNTVSANSVIALINVLPTIPNLVLSDGIQVAAARSAYDALTGPQKALVTNYSALTAAENQITALGNATSAVINAELNQTQASVNTANGVMGFVASGNAKTALQARLDAVQLHINDHTAAAAIEALIAALPTPANIVLGDYTQISAAWTAYWTSTEDQMALVSNYAKLASAWDQYWYLKWATDDVANAETYLTQSYVDTANNSMLVVAAGSAKTALQTRIDAVQKHINDHTAAAEVDSLISGLPSISDLDLDDTADVEDARSHYDALTADQKALVTNYDTLYSAESQILALDAATDAVETAELLLTQDSVDSANGYMGMVADGYAKQALQERLDAVQKHINDHTAAAEVDSLISGLPSISDLDLDDTADVEDARSHYDALTADQKALVTNYSTLTDAEHQIGALETATDAVENAELLETQGSVDSANTTMGDVAASTAKSALQTRIDAVQNIVDAKRAVTTAESSYLRADIDAAWLLVNALPDGAAKTSLHDRLDYVESQFDQHAADTVATLISAIPSINDLDLDDATQVSDARTAYDALTADQKALVTNYSTLTAAEDQISALETATDAVENAQLLETQGSVDSANTAMGDVAASTAKSALQTRIDAVQKHINDHTAAAEVDSLISGLPSISDLDLDDTADVEDARSHYDALTADQKALVTNYSTLTDAEHQIGALETATDAVENAELLETQGSVDSANTAMGDVAASTAKSALQTRIDAVQKHINDHIAAAPVEALIANLPLPADVVLSDEIEISSARAAYDLLTADQKALVSNYSRLTDAENQLEALEYASDEIDLLEEAALADMLIEANIDAAEAALADANSAMSDVAAGTPKSLLQDRIDAVSGGIAEARTRYDALERINAGTESFNDYSDAGINDAIIGNHTAYHDAVAAAKLALHRSLILSEVQTQINRVNLFAAAKSAVAAAEVSQTQGDVDSARGLVNALPNGSTKNGLNARLDAVQLIIDTDEADRVMGMISALGPIEDLVYGDLYDVDMALAAYNALTPSQKALVIGEELWHLEDAVAQMELIAIATETLDDLEFLLDDEDMTVLSNIEQAEAYYATVETALSTMVAGGAYDLLSTRLSDAYSAIQNARARYDALARINAGTEIMEDFDTAGVTGAIFDEAHKAAYDGAVESAILALGRDLTLAEVQEQVDLANVAPLPGSMTITTNERPGGITIVYPVSGEGEWYYEITDDFAGTESITGLTITLTGSNFLDLGTEQTNVTIDDEPAGYFDYSGSGNVWEYHGIGGTYSAGWHHLNATFTDRAGNSTRVSIYFEVVAPPPLLSCFFIYGSGGYAAHSHATDGVYPSINFYSGQSILGTTIIYIADDVGLDYSDVIIYVDGEPSGHSFTWVEGVWGIDGTPWVLPDGSHTMTFTFTNTRGGTVTGTVPFTSVPM